MDIPRDEWLTGQVARVAPFGLFVDVETPDGSAKADGLVHVSQIRDGFVENVEDEAQVGDEVKVRVVRVDLETGRMGLSMREGGGGFGAREKVDLTPFESVPTDTWLKGKVARHAPFGLFVTVSTPDGETTADGLVHITQIRDGFVENVEDEAEIGQEVNVWIQSVDVPGGKLSLSMKDEQGPDGDDEGYDDGYSSEEGAEGQADSDDGY